eukprot:3235516-Lingulodinium_polyedra.AAC.1
MGAGGAGPSKQGAWANKTEGPFGRRYHVNSDAPVATGRGRGPRRRAWDLILCKLSAASARSPTH